MVAVWTVKCVVESSWGGGCFYISRPRGGMEAQLGSPNPLILKSHWFQPHNELRSHWSIRQNLGRAGGQLRICVAFRKDFPQAAQEYFSSGSTGFAQQWIGCMARPQILNLKAFFHNSVRFFHPRLFFQQSYFGVGSKTVTYLLIGTFNSVQIELFIFACVDMFFDEAHLIQNMYKYVLQADRLQSKSSWFSCSITFTKTTRANFQVARLAWRALGVQLPKARRRLIYKIHKIFCWIEYSKYQLK